MPIEEGTLLRFTHMLTARDHRPTATVRVAQLGQDAGLIGAADLARM